MARKTTDNQQLRNALHALHLALINASVPIIGYSGNELYAPIKQAADTLQGLIENEWHQHTAEIFTEIDNF